MGILSSLIGQVSNFGLNYLNDYLVQKRLEDSMRQSTNYLTGTAIPAAKKATEFQQAMLEGQAPPGAASLLGFTSPPTVREPYGPQAQKLAESVQYNPQVPEGVPMTPQLQSQMMNIAGTVAGQPRAMVGEMQKGAEERAKIVNQRITQAHTILDPFIQYMNPDQVSSNIDLYSKTGAIPVLLRGAPKDMQQQMIKLAREKSYATGLGGAEGRGAYEAGPGMDILRRQEQIRGEARVKYREPKEPGKVPVGASEAIRKDTFSRNPELYQPVADPEDPTQTKQVLVPNETAQQIEDMANELLASDPQQNVHKAVTQARSKVLKGGAIPSTNNRKEELRKKGLLR